MPYRRGRIIDTGALGASRVLQVSSDDQGREQGSEDNNPNVNAHQSRPAAALPVTNADTRFDLTSAPPPFAVSSARS
jgi:hypothetical protein